MASAGSRLLSRDDDEEAAEGETSAPTSAQASRAIGPIFAAVTIAVVLFGAGFLWLSAASSPPAVTASVANRHPRHHVANHRVYTHARGPQFGLRTDRIVMQQSRRQEPQPDIASAAATAATEAPTHKPTAEELRSKNIRESQEDPTSMFDMSTP